MVPSDIVAARLDRLPVDEINGPRQQGFQRIPEIEKGGWIVCLRSELDQKISVARRNVEVRAARGGTEQIKPLDAITAAQIFKAFVFSGYLRVHSVPLSCQASAA